MDELPEVEPMQYRYYSQPHWRRVYRQNTATSEIDVLGLKKGWYLSAHTMHPDAFLELAIEINELQMLHMAKKYLENL